MKTAMEELNKLYEEITEKQENEPIGYGELLRLQNEVYDMS